MKIGYQTGLNNVLNKNTFSTNNQMFRQLTSQQKTIAGIVALALGMLIIGIVAFRKCSYSRPAISQKPQNQKFNQITTPLVITKKAEAIPEASNTKKCLHSFFVDILNSGQYSINGKIISIPPASMPVLVNFDPNAGSLENQLLKLKAVLTPSKEVKAMEVVVEDLSTEQAINVRNKHAKIALNFANEEFVGGPVPGFHRDPVTGKLIYDTPSATTQEESLCQRSNLMDSLTQLPHELEAVGGKMVRSYYLNPQNLNERKPFDSRKEIYVSDNHLFAVQSKTSKNFFVSHYLEDSAQPVSFLTSTATYHGNRDQLDCDPQSNDISVNGLSVYEDAYQRIRTHLFAAAKKSVEKQQKNPDEKIELILGAYGCGVFAPQGNPNEYRYMIAGIYLELIPQFEGFFDRVTYAIPTFKAPKDTPNELNYRIFNEVLS